MSTASFAVRNYRFVIVVTTALFFLGVLGFLKMPRQEDPNLSTFGGMITVVYPGGSVDEIEDRILEPLEEGIHEIEEIGEIRGTAVDNAAVIVAEIREDVDKDEAYDLLVQRLSALRGSLPEGVTDVSIRTMRPLDVVVFQIALVSDTAGPRALKIWAEELESRLRVLEDAGQVNLEGEQSAEVHVEVDPARLAEVGLTLGQVSDLIGAANRDIPGGLVQSGSRRLTVRPIAKFETLEDVERAVLTTVDGRPVLVSDVARVEWGFQDPVYLTRLNGLETVLVAVTQKEDRNIFSLAADVHEALDRFKGDLPAEIDLVVVHDQSESVRSNLKTFMFSLLQGGFIIVVLVAFITGLRSAVTVVAAILLSIGISFTLLEAWGLAIDQMTIAGLVTVLGLLVDNGIVVVEGILQSRQQGQSAIKAAMQGTERVATAVTSSTATTVAAFVPMMLTAGSVGEFTRAIPIVVTIVLVVSLLIALFVTPLTAAGLFRTSKSAQPFVVSRWLRRRVAEGWYDRALGFAVSHTKTTLAGAVLISIACLSLTPFLGMSFFPAAEKPLLLVRVEAPRGTRIASTRDRAVEVERYLMDLAGVKTVTTNVGKGNPQIYYNLIRPQEADHEAELFVVFEREKTPEVPEIARSIREHFADHPDFNVLVKVLMQGPPVGLPVSVELLGPDLERLSAHALELEAALRAIPGAVNVSNDLQPGPPRLDLEVDPVTASKLGWNAAGVAREIRVALAGERATVLRQGDDDYDVVVRVAPEGNESFVDLERVRLPVRGGTPVPIAQLTRPVLAPTYAAIHHTDLERSVIVGSDVDGRLAAEVLADLMPAVEGLDLGPEESWTIIGEDEERDRAFLSMLTNLITAIGLIYGILVLQFRSFKQPMIVFTSLPVALTGSALGLMLGGWSFGFTAFIGLLALTGIVVNNAIVLVDQINQLREAGMDCLTAVRTGAQSRLQPILMTTGTTIAGLLPLTLSRSSLWSPMGWVVIGGLIVSTVVTLFLVPAVYTRMERGRVRGWGDGCEDAKVVGGVTRTG